MHMDLVQSIVYHKTKAKYYLIVRCVERLASSTFQCSYVVHLHEILQTWCTPKRGNIRPNENRQKGNGKKAKECIIKIFATRSQYGKKGRVKESERLRVFLYNMNPRCKERECECVSADKSGFRYEIYSGIWVSSTWA